MIAMMTLKAYRYSVRLLCFVKEYATKRPISFHETKSFSWSKSLFYFNHKGKKHKF